MRGARVGGATAGAARVAFLQHGGGHHPHGLDSVCAPPRAVAIIRAARCDPNDIATFAGLINERWHVEGNRRPSAGTSRKDA